MLESYTIIAVTENVKNLGGISMYSAGTRASISFLKINFMARVLAKQKQNKRKATNSQSAIPTFVFCPWYNE